MVMTKVMGDIPLNILGLGGMSDVEIGASSEPGGAAITELPDGGVEVDFNPMEDEGATPNFGDNLAEFMDDDDLAALASELNAMYEADYASRKSWQSAYKKGLKLLGLEIDERTEPWAGACGVFHPILTEAVIRFQADTIMETFPASGPVKGKVIGKVTKEKEDQLIRVKDDMNYQLTEVMTEYRSEHEQLLFELALAGSAFKKVYFDATINRPRSMFVAADNLIVPYAESDMASAPRATHILKKSKNDVKRAMLTGFYRDIELDDPSPEFNDIDETRQRISGEQPSVEYDDRHTLLEICVDLDLEGFKSADGLELPYVITIEKSGGKVLAIRRNWREDDPMRVSRTHYVHYKYMTGLGFYGIGLIHLIGGLAKSATSITRQLIDAGTLSNLPAGLKTRGLRIKGDTAPIRPGEFRDVDVPGGTIRDNITFLPYKEPSMVLFQLLGEVVKEGRTIASVADMKISDMSAQAPVGTTLAIIERGMKVMSAVQARIHSAMHREFRLIHDLIFENMADEPYPFETEDPTATRRMDYDGRVDVVPVSDPNASTMAQRIMKYQAVLQLATTAPQLYDLQELHRQMVGTLGIHDANKIIPDKDTIKPMDPVAENMAIINGKPVGAHMYQDHEAHIQVHMAALQDPKLIELISKSPTAPVMAATMQAHLSEHLAFAYRKEVEKQLGVPLPAPDEELPEDIELQLSRLVVPAAEQLLQKNKADAQTKQAEEAAQDPVIQLQERELAVKEAEVQRRTAADQAKTAVSMKQIDSKEKIEGAKLGVEIKKSQAEAAKDAAIVKSKEKTAGAKLGADMAKTLYAGGTKNSRQ